MEQIVDWLFFTENVAKFWSGNGFSLIFAIAAVIGILACIFSKRLRGMFF